MKKTIILAFALLSFAFLPTQSSAAVVYDVSPAYMKVGDGATFTTLPVGGAWATMMTVGPINIPADVVCVVQGSYIVGNLAATDTIYTTVATLPAARGPWVQAYSGAGFTSGSMTQAFVVLANTPTTFYINGKAVAGSAFTENTRIWVSCQQGAIIPTAAGATPSSGGAANK